MSDQKVITANLIIYHSAKDDTSKIRAIGNICENLISEVWIKYEFFKTKLIEDALKKKPNKSISTNLNKALASNLNNLGLTTEDRGEINLSLEYYLEALDIYQGLKDDYGISEVFNNLGHFYNLRGNVVLALQYYDKSLLLKTKIHDTIGIALTYNNIGYSHANHGNKSLALKYYLKSLDIGKSGNNKKAITDTYNNIASIYLANGNLNMALTHYEIVLKMSKELGNKDGMAIAYNNIAVVYSKQKNPEKASEYCEMGLKLYEEINNLAGIAYTLKNLGDLKRGQNKLAEAKLLGERGMALSIKIGYPDLIMRNAILLSKIAIDEKDYKKALELRNLEIKMKDSLNSMTALRAIADQNAKFEYDKKQLIKDKEYEKDLALQEEDKVRQQIISFATAAGLILVIIFSIFVVNRLKLSNKQKTLIELAHQELEHKNEEILASINYAKRIQSAILPPRKLISKYLSESFVIYKPKDIVAGDFFWFYSTSVRSDMVDSGNGIIMIAVADCTGHGVPGALVSMVCNNGLNKSVAEYNLIEPGEILTKTREIVVAEFEKSEEDVMDGMDIALCSLEYNAFTKKTRLKFAGANNPVWIVREDSEELHEIKGNKQPIGKYLNEKPFETVAIDLSKGDTVYIFTDGFVDQFGGEGSKKFKSSNFRKLLLSIKNENMQQQEKIINETFTNWKNNLEQVDDVCVIGIRV